MAFFSKHTLALIRKNATRGTYLPSFCRNFSAIGRPFSSFSLFNLKFIVFGSSIPPKALEPRPFFIRSLHALQADEPIQTDVDDDENEAMEEFLSRFVYIMRGKLSEVYPDCDKETIDGMLHLITEKVVSEVEKGSLDEMLDSKKNSQALDLSEDLWKTIWEVCYMVLEDMKKVRKRENMKKFIHSEEVKEMYRFAGKVGIRGDMLRELRFEWAKEKMEEFEFYQDLERIRMEAAIEEEKAEREEHGVGDKVATDDALVLTEEQPKVVTFPQRRGKLKYKIYGLDLSSPKWAEISDRIHEADKLITPEEPKLIYGKCKVVTERILDLQEGDDPSPLLAEWVELLQPGRVDWLALLDKLKERNMDLYLKVAESVLSEESFGANIRDYSILIDAHAKAHNIEDAERILRKMLEKGIEPDILTSIILIHMYSAAGNLDRAKDAFEKLRIQGFQPDWKVYNAMIMAYVNAGQPKSGEALMREMEARDIKPSKETYMELLKAFAQRGHVDGAQRIVNTMQFAGFEPTLESCTLLVEAHGQAGDPDQARNHFDYMIKSGIKPDDRCTASMIAAYEKKNLLDKALELYLQLKKDGFEPGVATYTVFVDWLCKLQLDVEAEQMLRKVVEKGGDISLKTRVSLCDMYSRAHDEKKARESLAILEQNKHLLTAQEFERIINGLLTGGFVEDAKRINDQMQELGFNPSESIRVSFLAAQSISRPRPATR